MTGTIDTSRAVALPGIEVTADELKVIAAIREVEQSGRGEVRVIISNCKVDVYQVTKSKKCGEKNGLRTV